MNKGEMFLQIIKLNARFFIIVLLCALVGCTSISPVYVNKNFDQTTQINQVLIMVEYLELKDDVKGYWNFDEDINIAQQDQLYDMAATALITKGYEVSSNMLKTSGLMVERDFYADHYIDDELQNEAIAPPYIMRSIDMDDDNIYALESLLAALMVPVSPVLSDYQAFINTNYREQTKDVDVEDDTAIMIIQSYRPRSSFFSNIDIGFGISNSGPNSFANVGAAQEMPETFAYLIHKGSGDVMWANRTSLIKPKTQQKFFLQLPIK